MIMLAMFRSLSLGALTRITPAAAGLLVTLLPFAAAAQDAPDDEVGENSVSADYTFSHFDDIDPWHEASLTLRRRTSAGTIIGRANYANRFSRDGVQLEADAYPVLGEGRYAYLNVGYSDSGLFPEWRFGAELYSSLPSSWEASLGLRHLRFEDFDLTLYTGSIGKYYGNYWFSLRPSARMNEGSLSGSATLTGRRYFADPDEYIGAQVGYGSAPSERVSPTEVLHTSYLSASINGYQRIASNLLGNVILAYDREELGPDRFRNRFGVTTGMRLEF